MFTNMFTNLDIVNGGSTRREIPEGSGLSHGTGSRGYPFINRWVIWNGNSEHQIDDLGYPHFRKP